MRGLEGNIKTQAPCSLLRIVTGRDRRRLGVDPLEVTECKNVCTGNVDVDAAEGRLGQYLGRDIITESQALEAEILAVDEPPGRAHRVVTVDNS